MKTSETCVAQDEKLEAPISLTPEQLQAVAGGYGVMLPGTVLGFVIRPNPFAHASWPNTIHGYVPIKWLS
jgi:hypothetical protein